MTSQKGMGRRKRPWTAVRERPGSPSWTARSSRAATTGTSCFRTSGYPVSTSRRLRSHPDPVLDKQTGNSVRLTVIGILKDTAPLEMVGISTSEETLAAAFPGRIQPTIHYFGLAPGADPENMAAKLETAFLASGLEAESIQQVVDDAVAASLTFNRLIQGFMGLGLVVGVAALGVISARAVVERKQQIGVMRAIGFRRRMVQAAFLLESSFVALTAILVGTALGLLLAWNIIRDTRSQPSWENLELRRAVAESRRHLLRRLRGRPRCNAGARRSCLKDPAGRSAAIPVGAVSVVSRRTSALPPMASASRFATCGETR